MRKFVQVVVGMLLILFGTIILADAIQGDKLTIGGAEAAGSIITVAGIALIALLAKKNQ